MHLTGRKATTNNAEGFFRQQQALIGGAHHQIGRKHAHLYFAELDFKYNTRKLMDGVRVLSGIKRMEGKRLMLRRPTGKA